MWDSTWQWYSQVPGSLLAPAHLKRLGRAERLRVARDAVGSRQRWPWTWKVWCSEPIAITSHCTSWPTRDVEHRRVADERAAVDRLEVAHRGEDDDELAVGRALVLAEDREHPVHAAGDRVVHRRRVVVVGPDAGGVGAGASAVGPGLAGLDVGVAAGEAREVGAVGARLVVRRRGSASSAAGRRACRGS